MCVQNDLICFLALMGVDSISAKLHLAQVLTNYKPFSSVPMESMTQFSL